MQGKLVEQRPEEGTGEALYQEIQAEKKKLIQAGKIKKSKKLPEITEEEIPFEIPERWKWVRLNDCMDVRDGTHDSPKYYQKGFPLVTSKNLKNGIIDFSTCKLISEDDFNAINERSKVDKDDILFAMIGTVGNPVLYRGDAKFSIKNMALFKHIGSYLNMEYVYWYLNLAQEDMKKKASGGVQNFVSLTYLRNYLIALPPKVEQRRIVAKLEEIQPLLDRYEKAYNRLEAYNQKFPENLKKSILQYAIEGKLVEQRPEEGTGEALYQEIRVEKKKLIQEGKIKKSKKLPEITEDEIPFEIPKNWKWAKFGEIVDFFIGKTPKRHESQYWQKSEFPWVSISDLIDRGHIQRTKENISSQAAEKVFKNRFAPKGTLLMSFKLTIGKVSILDIDAFHNEAIISIFPIIERDNIFRDYLFDFLPLISAEGKTKSAIKGKTLNSNSLKNLLVPIPPLEEQKRIVAKVEELMPLVEKCGEDRKD